RFAESPRLASSHAVTSLRNGHEDRVLDLIPPEHHLGVVEPEHGESPQFQTRVVRDITPAVLGVGVMCEAVQLHDQSLADEQIDLVTVQPDLLAYGQSERTQTIRHDRLEPRVRQFARRRGQLTRARAGPRYACEVP